MTKILVIEDEAALRQSVARGLAKLPGIDVVDVSTVNDGLREIEKGPPALIISDIDLPQRSGLEILGELGRRSLRVPVVYVSAYLRAYGAQIPPHADVEVLEKPVSLETLRNVVRRRVSHHDSTHPASPFAVIDYFQLACQGRRSVVIEAHTRNDSGRIVVYQGTAWSAEDVQGQGVEAFRRLAFEREGRVECKALSGDPGAQNLFERWEELVLEAAQIVDETAHSSEIPADEAPASEPAFGPGSPASRASQAPSSAPASSLARAEPEAPPEPEPTPEEIAFNEAWDRGVLSLLKKDYSLALAAFLEAKSIRPDDKKVEANLARLRQLGVEASP